MSDPTTDDTTAVAAEDTDLTGESVTDELVTEELVEEVSIDGMCGVY